MTNLPIGSIILWETSSIPAGWQVCDGTNDTPDLRESFARGATDDADVLGSGGDNVHTHSNPNTSTRAAHLHTVPAKTTGTGTTSIGQKNSGYTTAKASHTHTFPATNTGTANAHAHTIGATGSTNNLPPYIDICYIMKIT